MDRRPEKRPGDHGGLRRAQSAPYGESGRPALRLGWSYLELARLPRIVQPFLQRVTAGTQESAYVSVMDGDEIVYIARNGTNRAMNTGYILGSRVQAQVTAAGLLMLALREPAALEHWQPGGGDMGLHPRA